MQGAPTKHAVQGAPQSAQRRARQQSAQYKMRQQSAHTSPACDVTEVLPAPLAVGLTPSDAVESTSVSAHSRRPRTRAALAPAVVVGVGAGGGEQGGGCRGGWAGREQVDRERWPVAAAACHRQQGQIARAPAQRQQRARAARRVRFVMLPV